MFISAHFENSNFLNARLCGWKQAFPSLFFRQADLLIVIIAIKAKAFQSLEMNLTWRNLISNWGWFELLEIDLHVNLFCFIYDFWIKIVSFGLALVNWIPKLAER